MPSPSKRYRNGDGQRAATCDDAGFRSLSLRASSLDAEARTIEADISTESPIPMPDWSRMEMVPEVLLSAGAQIPKSRQVPFLNSHNRASITDQLGSARDVTISGDKLTSRLHFSETASDEFTKVREGHVTDVSVGYEVLKRVFVPSGETKTISGRSFDGPVNVVTKWRLREVSLTPIGADAQAKLRGLNHADFSEESRKGQFQMNEALRKLLISRGMAEGLSDDEAQRWLVDNTSKLADPVKEERMEKVHLRSDKSEPAGITAENIANMIAEGTRKAIEAQQSKRAAFVAEVDSLCELADLGDIKSEARELTSIEAVRAFLTKSKSERAESIGNGPSIRVTGSGFERMQSDVSQAIALRALRETCGNEATVEKHMPTAGRSKNIGQWRNASLCDIAREVVAATGVDVRGLSREDIAQCALFGSAKIGVRSSGAYHTTGSFPALTLDAVNKSLTAGYAETPTTWNGPMRQGSSVADFKDKHVIRMGAVPNLPVWNDNQNPEKASFADAKVSYAVEARSLEIDFSYKLLINDDMDALSRTPSQMGAAAARTVNAVAWAQWTANPTMAYDSQALFSAVTGYRFRQNLTTGAGAPSVTTVGALTNLMRQMRGENTPERTEGADVLNLQPKFIIGPSALELTINQLVNSAYDPNASVNTMVYNPTRVLTPIIEPLLDASSTTAWYLAASPQQIDTVEVSFLQGHESPQVRTFMDERKLSQSFVILQAFAAKAINHRGLQKHAGA